MFSQQTICEIYPCTLLEFLAEKGHTFSKSKLQLVQQEVRDRGHLISEKGCALGFKLIESSKIQKRRQKTITNYVISGSCRDVVGHKPKTMKYLKSSTHSSLGLPDYSNFLSSLFQKKKKKIGYMPAYMWGCVITQPHRNRH